MNNKNLKFIKLLTAYEKKNNIDTIDRYTNGECSTLVYYLQLLNDEKGERIRILYNEDEDYYNPTLHFVYKIKNIYYDINGAFTSMEKLIEKCPLFSNFEELEIYRDEINPAELDLEEDEQEFIDIMNIIDKLSQKNKTSIKKY